MILSFTYLVESFIVPIVTFIHLFHCSQARQLARQPLITFIFRQYPVTTFSARTFLSFLPISLPQFVLSRRSSEDHHSFHHDQLKIPIYRPSGTSRRPKILDINRLSDATRRTKMGFRSASLSAYLLALAYVNEAHVLLKTPVPYGAATLNTNPLLTDGSDYPW